MTGLIHGLGIVVLVLGVLLLGVLLTGAALFLCVITPPPGAEDDRDDITRL